MGNRNEGEGNRTAAREYNADQQRFAQDKAKVKEQAEKAKQAVEGPEGEELKNAEKAGLKPGKH
ncbi:hypothetical protein ACFPL7_01660 [Dongia soli]|uniref:Uncharacterized protein n=1 Tax=Dongia soli TaxID=600628 RepID=A0ABU5EDF2_9PROT|nr:hypothetical protein [Dongia soli]MDY0884187.1 hypothetical protein [Dongia soli]